MLLWLYNLEKDSINVTMIFDLYLRLVVILHTLENVVGFINTPYEVQESERMCLVRVGMISGQLNTRVALLLNTRDDTATGEFYLCA